MSYYGYQEDKDLSLFPTVKNKKISIDFPLFRDLLGHRSHSRSPGQDRFGVWLVDWLAEHIPTALVERDKLGNIYITKGDAALYPCVVAHQDINQDEAIWDVHILQVGDWMLGIDGQSGKQCGLGFDDKNGMLFCLTMLRTLKTVKCFLPVDEECGAMGSYGSDKSFFSDCTMLLQLDRNAYAGPEFISYTNGIEVCSKEFIQAARKTFARYGYEVGSGTFTDIGCLKENPEVSCIAANIGCGYFDEHTDQEVTYLPALENAMNFAYELIIRHGQTKWHHVAPKKKAYGGWGTKALPSYPGKIAGQPQYDWGTKGEYGAWEYIDEEPAKPAIPWQLGTDYIADRALDYVSAQEELAADFCPNCQGDGTVTSDMDGMYWCGACDSYFNIPEHYHEQDLPREQEVKTM